MGSKKRKSGSGGDGTRAPRGGDSGIDHRIVIAISVVGLAGIVLLWIYAGAVADGLDWHRQSELRLIAPDLEQRNPKAAREIPDFALKDRFGRTVKLSQFAELDLLLINIWSSGCRACLEEVPALTEMDRRIGQIGKAALITIAVDEKWEDVSYYFPKGTDLRILFDPEDEVAKGIFGTSKYPETFVLDKQRRVRARFDGKRPWHSPVMFDYLGSFI
jgi:peroxiredoxin